MYKLIALAVTALALIAASSARADFQAQQVSPESIGAPVIKTSIVSTTPYVCYSTGSPSPLMSRWGTSPYDQKVYETRNWCGYLNDRQTWRVSSVQLGGGAGCGRDNPRQQLTAGGNGYFYATVMTTGHFDCVSYYPYFHINVDDWQKWRCNMAGYCTFVDAGRL